MLAVAKQDETVYVIGSTRRTVNNVENHFTCIYGVEIVNTVFKSFSICSESEVKTDFDEILI